MVKRILLFSLMVLLVFALSCNKDSSPTTPLKTVGDRNDLAQKTHTLINNARAAKSLRPLAFNSDIAAIALRHSEDMATGTVPFSHDGFDGRVEAISKKIDIRSAGENVAYNMGYADPAATAVDGWLASPGHYENIMGDYNVTGIGVAENDEGEFYFTQLFALSLSGL